jgi:WD40 repeat protein
MGEKAILGIGRADGRVLLWSPLEQDSRFDSVQPAPVCCVAFRPTTVKRQSIRDPYIIVDTEELLIGDEVGHVYFYSVEWPSQEQRELFGWPGALTLLARITAHTQQICGLAWSTDGDWFASGANDNYCHLHETKKVLQATSQPVSEEHLPVDIINPGGSRQTVDLTTNAFTIPASVAKHKWTLQAAIKAIAFCPWQRGLLAVGGGSNDRCIHFYHTISGACLATIDCSAQVTSLIWSTTRREIAATFGFAQPDHPYRIAVFAWPSCEQIVAIPWYDEHRALYAISYPGGPNLGRTRGEGGMWWSRTQEEGCLVVATSDCSIKFHEIWAEEKKATASKGGLLGGSDILEALHGIDKVGEVIR